jgi:hypothetical protein
VVRRVLAKRCNWGWRAWTWIQKDPVRAGLMDCGFMGIGLALTVHLSQQFPSSVWLFAGGLAHAKFRLAAAQFWPRHARHRAHRHEGLAMPIAVVLGVIGLSWIPRNQLWVVCAALVLAAAFVAVRAVRCAQLDRARMRQHALQFLNSKISRSPCSGASGADCQGSQGYEQQHAWSIASRLASCHDRYQDTLPPEVGGLIAEAADLFPEMVRSAHSR